MSEGYINLVINPYYYTLFYLNSQIYCFNVLKYDIIYKEMRDNMKKVVIVGGGIVGLTCGYFLSKSKKVQVTLIDTDLGQASKNAAGIICPWLSLRRNKPWLKLVDAGAKFYPYLMQELENDGITSLPYKKTGTFIFKKDLKTIEKILTQVCINIEIGVHPGKLEFYNNEKLKEIIPDYQGSECAIFAHEGGRVDGAYLIEILKSLIQKHNGTIINGKAIYKNDILYVNHIPLNYDEIVFACGAWTKEILNQKFDVDITPQKGQLVELYTDLVSDHLPGFMLQGEIDILPQENGRFIIGATHENNMNFDLSIDYDKINEMKKSAFKNIDLSDYHSEKIKVGTRAYTSDFTPFFGKFENFYIVSGLGSSGLTNGPYIAYHIANRILKETSDLNYPEFEPNKYIKKKSSI